MIESVDSVCIGRVVTCPLVLHTKGLGTPESAAIHSLIFELREQSKVFILTVYLLSQGIGKDLQSPDPLNITIKELDSYKHTLI